jgi:hypothetical protein
MLGVGSAESGWAFISPARSNHSNDPVQDSVRAGRPSEKVIQKSYAPGEDSRVAP